MVIDIVRDIPIASSHCFCSHCGSKAFQLSAPWDPGIPCALSSQLLGILVSLVSLLLGIMADSKFQRPQAGEGVDQGRFKKLAQRVEETLTQEILFKDPKQIEPQLILVAPNNRTGAPPNQQHLHFGILKSFKTKGFDRTRAAVGICIKFTSEAGKKALLEHNKRFTKGNKLLPPIDEEQALYGSLACSHYNLALRCLKCGLASPLGNLSHLLDENEHLKDAAMNGHRWWVLPESVTLERQVDISLWRNMDQNENQSTHEVEILQGIKATAQVLSLKVSKVSLADLVALCSRRNPAKISPRALTGLSKFYIGFLENSVENLIMDLVDFHSQQVDPQELTVSTSFFEILMSEEALGKCPYTRLALLLTQYTTEKTKVQAGGPSVSQFLESSVITGLCKKPDTLKLLENRCRESRSKFLPLLENHLSESMARIELQVYLDLLIRCVFNKPWPKLEPKVVLPCGKFCVEKMEDLAVHWAKVMDLKYPDLNFAEAAGLQDKAMKAPAEDLQKEIDLKTLSSSRELKRNLSEGEGPEVDLECKFKRGDEVTVVRRMSWILPQPGNPKYRKDLVEGTSGVIEGFADLEHRQVLLKVILDLPSGPKQAMTKEVYPRNLMLTSEYQAQEAPAEPEEKEDPKATACPSWILQGSSAQCLKVEQNWKSLVADQDRLIKVMQVKSRIGVALEAMSQSLPKFTEKDLLVVHRQNDKGLWRDEVWTKRPFEALELQLGPYSSQLKDSHLTLSYHAIVGLPKHGKGAHPEHQTIALDGRGRTMMAASGSIDGEEHTGSLFWMVSRTSKASQANMAMETLSFEQSIKVSLPGPKRRKTLSVQWDSSDMPTLPILVNKKALPKHIMLLVFQAEKKKEEKKKD